MFKRLSSLSLNMSPHGLAFRTRSYCSLSGEPCSLRRVVIRSMLVLLLSLIFDLAIQRPVLAYDDVHSSVVKILATRRLPDMLRPWTKKSPQEISGSGVVIEGNRILTNAHIVAFASQIYVQPFQSAEKFAARVVAEAPGVDLAVLELEDVSFFQIYPSLPLAEKLPRAKDTVNVYGYPVGGKEQSVTEGIVSRIEYSNMYYNVLGLRIQIDAALNPGNSGGPAINDEKIVGLVFSKIKEAESVGYLIPVEEIKMFLNDITDGTYEGQPRIRGVSFQTCENDALRDWLGIQKDITGIMVTRVRSRDPDFQLKLWDLVTHLGQHPIDSEGHVRVHGDLRLPAFYFVPRLVNDGKVEMTVIRNGQTRKMQVPVCVDSKGLTPFKGNEYPRYFIYGPLVFTPVTYLFVRAIPPRLQHYLTEIGSPIVTRRTDSIRFEEEELVALAPPMFPHRITKGYDPRTFGVVSHVNDLTIKNLPHLVKTLRESKEEYVTFRFANLRTEMLVFHRQEIETTTAEILRDNGIRYQYSKDLRSIWEEATDN